MWNFLKPIFGENEVVDSFAYNLRTKLTNPFFGTLIVVWVVHNWELVYTFFTFDSESGLDFRVSRLKTVADEVFKWSISDTTFEGFGWNLLLCVFWTLVAMMISFVFLAFSKWISGIYQDRVLPNVYRITSKSKYKTIEEYEALDSSLNSLRTELKKEKEEKVAVESENSKLKKKDEEIQNKYAMFFKQKGREAVNEILNEIVVYFMKLSDKDRNFNIEVLRDLVKNKEIANSGDLFKLVEKGILEIYTDEEGVLDTNKYVLTPVGKLLVQELRKNKMLGKNEMVRTKFNKNR